MVYGYLLIDCVCGDRSGGRQISPLALGGGLFSAGKAAAKEAQKAAEAAAELAQE